MLCISAADAVVRCLPGQPRCLAIWVSVTFVYCVETARDTAIVAMEYEYETVPKLFNGTIFNDLE